MELLIGICVIAALVHALLTQGTVARLAGTPPPIQTFAGYLCVRFIGVTVFYLTTMAYYAIADQDAGQVAGGLFAAYADDEAAMVRLWKYSTLALATLVMLAADYTLLRWLNRGLNAPIGWPLVGTHAILSVLALMLW